MYYQATGGPLGKLYSVTMMVVLNNRIVLQAQDESMVLDGPLSFAAPNLGMSSTSAFDTSSSGILAIHEQSTAPPNV